MRIEVLDPDIVLLQPTTTSGAAFRADQVIYSVPTRFAAHVDDGALDWDVTLILAADSTQDLAVVVDELTIRRREGGKPASAAGVRHVPVGLLITEAIAAATRQWRVTGDDGETVRIDELPPSEPKPKGRARTAVARAATERKRKNEVTRAERDEALALYERAKADRRRGALEWTAAQLGLSRSAVHVRIQQAQKERRAR